MTTPDAVLDDPAGGGECPEAWDYLGHGVAGAVQFLETIHAFRAEHVYSAARRGFSARLTARQVVDLESDPAVAYVEADGTMSDDNEASWRTYGSCVDAWARASDATSGRGSREQN